MAAALVADVRDLVAGDLHLRQRAAWATVAPGTEVDATAIRLAKTPGACARPGPLLGEHTDQVLRDVAGLGAAELAELRANGVVA